MTNGFRSHLRRNLVAYLALGAALSTAAGVAYSAIPDAQGVIHACYTNGGAGASRALRVLDTEAGDTCGATETALNWNQHGQPGAPGAKGAAGPQGPAGVATTYARSRSGPVSLPDTSQPKAIATMYVPRGNYAIFAKAVGAMSVPNYSCPPGTDVYYCVLQHNERRLAATIFGCAVEANGSSDLGRANLIAGANAQSAYQTVSASVVVPLLAASNKVTLRCLQYGGGKWPAKITNARLIAMKIQPGSSLGSFAAIGRKVTKSQRKPHLKPLRRVLKKLP
jgi:hypothetical protein